MTKMYQNTVLSAAPILLSTADHTGEFFLFIIRRTGKPIAMSFNMKEMTSINVILASWYGLHDAIHTDIFSSSIVYRLRHEVAIVLSGPPIGTRHFGRNHDNCVFGRNVAYSTWSIVLIATRHRLDILAVISSCPPAKLLVTYVHSSWLSESG